jgi:hypothetical protein
MHVGDSLLRHDFRAMLRIPAITRIFSLSATEMTTPKRLYYRPFEVDRAEIDAYASYYEHWTSMFRLWRGSIDLEFHFFTSPLISSRVMFYWWNKDEAIATDPSDYAFKKIVTIKGSTSVRFSIPYVNTKQWTSLYEVPQPIEQELYIKVLDAPTASGDVAAVLHVIQVAAAGSDYQITSLRSPSYAAQIPALDRQRAQAQMRIRTSFGSGDFPNFTGGSGPIRLKDLSEDHGSVEDFMLRVSGHNIQVPTDSFESVYPPVKLWSPSLGVFHFVWSSFRYWRGDAKFHFYDVDFEPDYANFQAWLPPSTTRTVPGIINFPETYSNGTAMNAPAQNSVFTIQHPYVSVQEWSVTSINGEGPDTIGNPPALFLQSLPKSFLFPATTRKIQVCAGDNFQVAFIMPPRKFSYYCWWNDTPYTASDVPT